MTKKIKNIMISSALVATTLFNVATLTFAQGSEAKKHHNVDFTFNEIPLESIFQLMMDATDRRVKNFDQVPEVIVSIHAIGVRDILLEAYLLQCSGLKLESQGNTFNLVKNGVVPTNEYVIECIELLNS